jgi:hypothetical protein
VVPPSVAPVRNCGASSEHTRPVGGVRWRLARFSLRGC